MWGKRRPPTDYKLLRAIHDAHYGDFVAFEKGAASRHAKNMVPIDIPAIAAELEVDVDTVFGRLYYHLDPSYSEEREDRPRKSFFQLQLGPHPPDVNTVNFPLLESVLAALWEEHRRQAWTVGAALASLIIAGGSLAVSIVALAGG